MDFYKVLKKAGRVDLALLAEKYDISNKEKVIQQALVDSGQRIIVDGIFGSQTLKALLYVDRNRFYDNLNKLETLFRNSHTIRKSLKKTFKESILQYLAIEEGTIFHWNKNETTYTTPYGVYKKANRNEEIIKYSDLLFKKYALRENKAGAKKLNRYLTSLEREKIRDLVYDLYMRKYMPNKINNALNIKTEVEDRDKEEFSRLKLSAFSLSVNAGKKKAIFKMQQVVKAFPDGLFGPETEKKIINFKVKDGYTFNILYLRKVKEFYDSLIRNNPERYEIFERGWYNRLRRLGLKI